MNNTIRQIHRWLAIVLTLAVVVNITALAMKSQAFWIGLLALIPLLGMMATGLYMFIQPYRVRGRRAAG